MKKLVAIAAFAVLVLSGMTLNAQNKFKGIVKYSVRSTGEVAIEIPEQAATSEVKVLGDKIMQGSNALQDGNTVYSFIDLSQLIAYLSYQDMELESYSGDGKIYTKHTYTQLDIDSITIPVTEGYYVELIAGETKKIAGYDAKKAVLHVNGPEEQTNIDVWYTPEIGPAANFISLGVGFPGMPLEFTQTMEGGKAITMTATEVVKGKVKDVDFLMPAGFKLMEDEAFKALQTEVQETIELLQGE